MNILIKNGNPYLHFDIESDKANIFKVDTTDEAIKLLTKHFFNKILIYIKSTEDISLLKYINKYYKNMEVLISVDNKMKELFSTIKLGSYKCIDNSDIISKFLK